MYGGMMTSAPSHRPKATELEITEGMAFDRGYSSPYFVTDQERRECVFENALILITDRKISTIADLVPILEAVSKNGRPLLILSEEVEGEALATLVVNKTAGCSRWPPCGPRASVIAARPCWLTSPSLLAPPWSAKTRP